MQTPIQITFRHMAPSTAIEGAIRTKAAKLERFAGHITGCHVVVETPHRRHARGNLYRVSVDLTLPGTEMALSRDPAEHHAHEDAYVAIRDAFEAAVRRVEDHVRRRRG